MNSRVYVCHTFYHVYVSCLKELVRRQDGDTSKAALVLSKMSNDFGNLRERAERCGLFSEVIEFDEKNYTFFPELVELKKDRGGIVRNMLQRIRFCKRSGELLEPFVPVDFAKYRDIYVFCDSDPIGYYLAWKKIRYHAVEDGLDCLRYRDTAREDNKGSFAVKALFSRLGLIFIQNGYSRYCIDMEVNDKSVLDNVLPNMVEVSREGLVNRLTESDRELLVKLFIENKEELMRALETAEKSGLPSVLILTEPLCESLETRRKLFEDMIREYAAGTCVVIKPHPRDKLDYREAFPEHVVLDSHFPMEILNLVGAQFERVVTVYTVPSSIHCAKEKVYLGNEFMDRYEDPALHAKVKNAVHSITKQQAG